MNTAVRPTYQLTKHAIGSLNEIWAISWPLMLGLFSGSLMFFADRLILAQISSAAMNAAAIAGLASWGFMILPFVMAEMTEVFVGRFNGENRLDKVGSPVWQMLWLILMISPIFWIGSRIIAPILFYGTGNTLNESEYFIAISDFLPFFIGSVALAGFFIATGRTKVVTYTMVIANCMNILLDIIFVFGFDMGCFGAAFATGLSQLIQCTIYLFLFLQPINRQKYGTNNYFFDKKLTIELLKIATPSGFGRLLEVLAHIVFFRIMILAGPETMTCATLVQSLFLLLGFIVDGLSKGVTAVFSNLFGASRQDLLQKVLKSAFSLHLLIFLGIATIVLSYTEEIAGIFFATNERHFLQDAQFLFTLKKATFWMMVFFLFDGFCWIFFGLFNAARDTKFVMYTNGTINWVAYVLPVYIVIGVYNGSADLAWMILALYNTLICSIYYWRYRKKIAHNLEMLQNI